MQEYRLRYNVDWNGRRMNPGGKGTSPKIPVDTRPEYLQKLRLYPRKESAC